MELLKQAQDEMFESVLEKAKQNHDTASLRKGQKASNKASRLDLDLQFRLDLEGQSSNNANFVSQTVIGEAYLPCVLPISHLRPVTIDELRLETVHRGRVLIVRTFGNPRRIQSVQNAIEDGDGAVDRLNVYNFEPELNAERVLPKGAIFAVKEPYYKVTADGGYTIRVDHPTDLVRLEEDDALVPGTLRPRVIDLDKDDGTALEWKAKGNTAFKAHDYSAAVDFWSKALDRCIEDSQAKLRFDLHRNKSIANIHLERYEAGLADAEAAVIPTIGHMPTQDVKNNGKAYYRAGCAAYHLQDYHRAEELFQKVQEATPGDEDAIRELRRTALRLHEQFTGEYDFLSMTKSVTATRKRLDHANYTAVVEVRDTHNKGRGLFARTDIKAGQLVLCEKAFCVAFDTDPSVNQSMTFNFNTKTVTMGTHNSRLINAIHKMIHNPKQAQKFLELYDGGYSRVEQVVRGGRLIVDTFQTQAALEHNGFACPSVPDAFITDPATQAVSSTGVWLTPSAINHDCIGNVTRAFIGDMIVIRATKVIKKDEEITFRYKNADVNIDQFQSDLQESWKFKCSCVLCTAEEKTLEAQRKERIKVSDEIDKLFQVDASNDYERPPRAVITKAESLRAKMASLYDKELFDRLPRVALHDLDMWLCTAYGNSGKHGEVRRTALLVLSDLGYDVEVEQDRLIIDRQNSIPNRVAVEAGIYLSASYDHEGQEDLAKQAYDFVKGMYEILFGSLAGFEEKYAFHEGQAGMVQ